MSKRRNRSIEANLTIDDLELHWSLRSEPRWTPEGGYQGLTFSVRVTGEPRRELVLEFPWPGEKPTRYVSVIERPDVSPASVETGIRLALDDGWKPLSRGRAYHFAVPQDEA